MKGVRSVLLGVLIVAASVGGAVSFSGSVAGQTATYEEQFSGSPSSVGVDTGNYSGQFTIQVSSEDAPGGDTVLFEKSYDASNSARYLMFTNGGAYGDITVSAIPEGGNSGEPSLVTNADLGTVAEQRIIGTTGSDADLVCDLSEQISQAIVPNQWIVDCNPLPGTQDVNTSGLDATESHLEMYQSAQNSKAGAESTKTVIDNYLEDTKTQARIIGKNAYIRELNNGSSESAATTAAKSAVADYYATKEVNLLNEWNRQIYQMEYLMSEASNTAGVSASTQGTAGADVGLQADYSESQDTVKWVGSNPKSYTLTNGSTADHQQVDVYLEDVSGDFGGSVTFSATNGQGGMNPTGSGYMKLKSVYVKAPNSNYENLIYLDLGTEYNSRLAEIRSQNNQVQSDMDTLANNTYDEYQSGDINSSDLADPYTLSQSSPSGDFEGWAAGQLSLLGVNSPSNLDQTGSFNISTENGETYRGMLYSQDNPASGSFEVGNTYNPANIGGAQYVATSDGLTTLKSNFTIDSIETTDGETIQNVTIEEKQYSTTNVSELQTLYEQLAEQRAEIELRKQALQSFGGAGGLLGGASNSTIALIAAAGAAILLLQDE